MAPTLETHRPWPCACATEYSGFFLFTPHKQKALQPSSIEEQSKTQRSVQHTGNVKSHFRTVPQMENNRRTRKGQSRSHHFPFPPQKPNPTHHITESSPLVSCAYPSSPPVTNVSSLIMRTQSVDPSARNTVTHHQHTRARYLIGLENQPP